MINQITKMEAAGNSKEVKKFKYDTLEEALQKIGGSSLEVESGQLKYRPIVCPVQIGRHWYTVLIDSGAGSSLADEKLIDMFFATVLLWGVWNVFMGG